jgi:RHS repeat-associated protein
VSAVQEGLGYTGEWVNSYRKYGLLYLRARWLDVYLNRFISPDTIVPDYRNPQSINRYLYALANPVNLVDPSGLFAIGCADYDAYNLTDWLVREMHHQSNHWPVQWGISLLNFLGRYYDSYDGPPHDMVILSLLQNLQTYIPWHWDEHSYRNDIATLAYTGASLWWAGMVKDGARWDSKDQIKDTKYGPGESIILCDIGECRWYEHSMPGNIFYAYVGRVAGFGEWDLRVGAVYAQQNDPENDPALNDWLGLDQATDQAALDLGFMMYDLTYGAVDEITVRYAFKTALLIHKDRLAQGSEPLPPYFTTEFPIGPDGPVFPLGHFDGTNVMGWMGE